MPKRCLIVGASGQLGMALAQTFRQDCQVLETFHQPKQPGQRRLDLTNESEILETLRDFRPDWILNAGAFCNVDRCENEPEQARRVNVEGIRFLATFVRAHGGAVATYSTDHVFDGARSSNVESDPVHPLNVYAASKVEGEVILQTIIPSQHLILRTAWVYGPDPLRRNFILRLVDRLRAGERVPVPQDQWGSPTYTEDLARVTRFLLEHGQRGLFHATGPDFLDRVSLARQVCVSFRLEGENLLSTPTAELGQAATRPLRVRLNCQKLRATGAPAFRPLSEGLEALEVAQAVLTRKAAL